jgi:hypothetical protein
MQVVQQDPKFSRKDVSSILNVTTLTIANREKAGKYPLPKRDLNDYRVYSLRDVVSLQRITYGSVDFRPIISVLYDKGFTDPKVVGKLLDNVESGLKGTRNDP